MVKLKNYNSVIVELKSVALKLSKLLIFNINYTIVLVEHLRDKTIASEQKVQSGA